MFSSLESVLAVNSGRPARIDIAGRSETWLIDVALRVAGAYQVGPILFQNLPDRSESTIRFVQSRAKHHGVELGSPTEVKPELAVPAQVTAAQQAFESGRRFFQIQMPLSTTFRGSVTGIDTQTSRVDDVGWLLTEIEAEGWELFDSGFVFLETGQVSRDKFLTSGQSTSTTGQLVGIYLFRSTHET